MSVILAYVPVKCQLIREELWTAPSFKGNISSRRAFYNVILGHRLELSVWLKCLGPTYSRDKRSMYGPNRV